MEIICTKRKCLHDSLLKTTQLKHHYAGTAASLPLFFIFYLKNTLRNAELQIQQETEYSCHSSSVYTRTDILLQKLPATPTTTISSFAPQTTLKKAMHCSYNTPKTLLYCSAIILFCTMDFPSLKHVTLQLLSLTS